jgi:hypothetical protein
MNGIVYIIGLVVVVVAVSSFFRHPFRPFRLPLSGAAIKP